MTTFAVFDTKPYDRASLAPQAEAVGWRPRSCLASA